MLERMFQSLITSNPLFRRAAEMGRGKSEEQLRQIAQNMCRERGISFEDAFAEFQRQYPQFFK